MQTPTLQSTSRTFQPLLFALNCFLILFQFLFCEMAERVGRCRWRVFIIFKLHWLEKRKPQNTTVKKSSKQTRCIWLMSLFCPKFGDTRLVGNTEENHRCIQMKITPFNRHSCSNEHWAVNHHPFAAAQLLFEGFFFLYQGEQFYSRELPQQLTLQGLIYSSEKWKFFNNRT